MARLFGKRPEQLLQDIAGVSDPLRAALEAGQVFIAGQAITLGGTLSSERAALRLENPAGSAVVVQLLKVTIYSSVAQQVRYRTGATLSPNSSVAGRLNANMSSTNASKALLSYSTAAVTNGTLLANESRVNANDGVELQFPPLLIAPSQSLTIHGTVGDAQTFTANAYWIEKPL